MDDNLSLSAHINEVCKNATPAIRSIGCTRKYFSYNGLEMFTYNVYLVLINALVICNSFYMAYLNIKEINFEEFRILQGVM